MRGATVGSVTSVEITDEDLLTSWELITRAVTRTQERVLARIEDGGMPAQWFTALHLLLRSKEHRLPMSLLARDLSMTSGGFTKLADRMGQEGLIDRRASANDRRVVYATLTEMGLRQARRSERQYKAALREHVLDVLSQPALIALAETVRALDEAITDVGEDVPAVDALAPRRRLPEGRERRARARS
jgi:DNA-binding MarR family transcriptional regulator